MMPKAMRFPGSLVFLSLSLALLTFSPAPAKAAEKLKLLGKYGDWAAYTYGSGKDRICYAMTEPKQMLPKGATRGDVYFMVTHRPARGTRNEISMRVGYPFSPESHPYATIDKEKFQLFTGVKEGGEHRFWAWLDNVNRSGAMVDALKKGYKMVIKGTSTRKTLTTDTYSLKGSADALAKIDAACPK